MEIHALHQQGWTISPIARHLGKDRKTIRAYLAGEHVAGERAWHEPDPFEKFAASCAERLREDPHLWASALFDEVLALGYAWCGANAIATQTVPARQRTP